MVVNGIVGTFTKINWKTITKYGILNSGKLYLMSLTFIVND